MRYWIYWNDLVQGPFELDELVALRAFDENLVVCMENRQEWLPASLVADLSPALEILKSRRNQPSLPPPPPPQSAPDRQPLQGDFFGESPGQKHLFDLDVDDKGPRAYRPALDAPPLFDDSHATATMPFHFGSGPAVAVETRVPLKKWFSQPLEVLDVPDFKYAPPRPVKDSVVLQEALDIVEPTAETSEPAPVSLLPDYEHRMAEKRDYSLLPWVLGVFMFFTLGGSGAYWFIDHYSSRSAISEVSHDRLDSIKAMSNFDSHIPASADRQSVMPPSSPWQSMVNTIGLSFAKLMTAIKHTPGNSAEQVPVSATGSNHEAAAGRAEGGDKSILSLAANSNGVVANGAGQTLNSFTPNSKVEAVSGTPLSTQQVSEASPVVGISPEIIQPNPQVSVGGKRSVPPEWQSIAASVAALFARVGAAVMGGAGTSTGQILGVATGPNGQAAAAVTQDSAKSAVSPVEKSRQVVASGVNRIMNGIPFPAGPMDEPLPTAIQPVVPVPAGGATTVNVARTVPSHEPVSHAPTKASKKSKAHVSRHAMKAKHATHASESEINSLVQPDAHSEAGVGHPHPPVVLPGVASAGLNSVKPSAPEKPGVPAAKHSDSGSKDPWSGRQMDAINLVIKYPIPAATVTVGEQAKLVLEDLHEKELLHAADTGERLYLPDKIAWAALRQDGPLYRVYLNFSALRADGNRVQGNSYQFLADLKKKSVDTDEDGTRNDFLNAATLLHHKHNPMADDIESLLSAVDTLDKHQLHAILVHKMHHTKDEEKNAAQGVAEARERLQRAAAYFRTHYSEKAMRNIAKAYQFSDTLNSHG